MKTVKLKHPEAKGTIEVREDFVEMHESQGWVEAEKPAPAADKK